MTTPLDIGQLLIRTRRAQGVSQRELGDTLGVRQQQVARWEATGYRSASLERVDAAAQALGLDVLPPGAVQVSGFPLAAETPTTYAPSAASTSPPAVLPVRDLGEIAARIRANGEELHSVYRIQRVGVFGSFVFGEQTPSSDVDLLVETDDPGGFRFVEAADFAEQILGRHVDFVRPQSLRDRLRDRVMKDVVYVWTA